MSFLDRLCCELDHFLRTVCLDTPQGTRPSPAAVIEEPVLSSEERQHAAGLMRVNHAGEICAQALYQGQAWGARDGAVQKKLLAAAREEQDHLDWCAKRLEELQSHRSYLSWFWYLQSFGLGLVMGCFGDTVSLGFLAETERQVEAHLQSHLNKLPEADYKSRAIVSQMAEEEAEHADWAMQGGGQMFPEWARQWMRRMARVMTTVAYRV